MVMYYELRAVQSSEVIKRFGLYWDRPIVTRSLVEVHWDSTVKEVPLDTLTPSERAQLKIISLNSMDIPPYWKQALNKLIRAIRANF